MSDRETQQARYLLTPKGCAATGGHSFLHGICRACGTDAEQADKARS